ncbi:uncharacterized protein LOC110370740 isoform X1 [Helicoverpa armigera]|uniref:uncharacterized protein LOC110370740 isoform X1 n=1 Tax=Helicoverpa armigera TaxID=29058 RepID=UPI000B38B785|nr:uncharacterized protein LOC110370740 isoform X1 [Helicoverpa armigera]XP_047019660.1 uncharacterized protein LOC124630003 isoform X1 [Helicoverpa zea]
MNHYVKIALVVCACIALTSAQFGHYDVDFSDFGTSFGGAGYNSYAAAARDPRANQGKGFQGPVLFPPSPSGDPSQTSGVVVGASGYGFVPPGSQGPAIPRFFYRRRLYLRR